MFNNLHELIATMPDEATCRKYYEQQRWNGKPVCPYCGCLRSYKLKSGKHYKCADKTCYRVYTVTVGTIFEDSNIPLNKWFMALYITTAHKKGISSVQLSKDIGVTQKTGWFMLHRIRHGMKERGAIVLNGIVEIDETYMSRKYGSKYKAIPPGRIVGEFEPVKRKQGAVVAVKQRDGNVIAKAFDKNSADAVKSMAEMYISKDAKLMTDESLIYRKALKGYNRQSVNHSAKEFVRGEVHTNGVENFWSVMKRGVYGIYHQISYKHLQNYCDEFAYRYNSRKVKDADRFVYTLSKLEYPLPYKTLVNKPTGTI